MVLDAYFTQEDCTGFAYWFADPLLVGQLIPTETGQTGLEAELQVALHCRIFSSWNMSWSTLSYTLKENLGFKPASVQVKLPG